jgi:hypothetical protein
VDAHLARRTHGRVVLHTLLGLGAFNLIWVLVAFPPLARIYQTTGLVAGLAATALCCVSAIAVSMGILSYGAGVSLSIVVKGPLGLGAGLFVWLASAVGAWLASSVDADAQVADWAQIGSALLASIAIALRFSGTGGAKR